MARTDLDRLVVQPYSPSAMFYRSALILCVLALTVELPLGFCGDEAPAKSEQQIIVLRNGELLSGHVSRDADRYVIDNDGAEARLPARTVDFVCGSLDEAYHIQAGRIVKGRIDDHLNLAQWCLHQGLNGYAACEITAAMAIDPGNPRVALLDGRLQQAQRATPPSYTNSPSGRAISADPVSSTSECMAHGAATKSSAPIPASALERQVRALPSRTVENFTLSIQPMLLNYCATAGCHGPSAASGYTLLRPPFGSPPPQRLTQRNLYNTMQWINHEKPSDSKLLSAAQQAHAMTGSAGTGGLSPAQYQELVAWVWQSTMPAKTNVASAVIPSKGAGSPQQVLMAAPILSSPEGDSLSNQWLLKDGAVPTPSEPDFSVSTSVSTAPIWASPPIRTSANRQPVAGSREGLAGELKTTPGKPRPAQSSGAAQVPVAHSPSAPGVSTVEPAASLSMPQSAP